MQLKPGETNPAADKCRACCGWCCYRFYMRLPIKDGEVDWQDISEACYDESEYEFMKTNFKVVGIGDYYTELTCRLFDTTVGVCTVYDRRPNICRKYVCDTAYYLQVVPDRVSYPVTAKAMTADGLDVRKIRGYAHRKNSKVFCEEDDVFYKLHSTNMSYPQAFDECEDDCLEIKDEEPEKACVDLSTKENKNAEISIEDDRYQAGGAAVSGHEDQVGSH